ncbi:ARL14 effector protein [Tribolium castaneum]|uniref:ARL14 effector protein-like Protein n=1 Tax=Tribolium castaneum TaxID=7070 RepID=D6X220_TRICA|nr:PREDICTED: ARL14 effector protein [Tribolium castaneum]EFA09931.1 ARL14 effector protein-like Protein [Tribolium castaneum]|eukprot:XP_008197761.1 PREDICTED: ARL14 effector protein [Tribolium castaneum]
MSSESSEEDEPRPSLHRVAKKSTSNPKPYPSRIRTPGSQKTLTVANRFLENFNPETSIREKRKLNRKINPPSNVRRPPGALYDENGIHIATCIDLCDCLSEECVGCFLPCPKCGSRKCGIDCRVHRKYVYDQLEYHGYDIVVKNPLFRN